MPHSIRQTLPWSRFWRILCDLLPAGRPGQALRIQRRILLADVAAAKKEARATQTAYNKEQRAAEAAAKKAATEQLQDIKQQQTAVQARLFDHEADAI